MKIWWDIVKYALEYYHDLHNFILVEEKFIIYNNCQIFCSKTLRHLFSLVILNSHKTSTFKCINIIWLTFKKIT